MTNLNDLDHALAEFLADGPTTAPEAPVIAALAHARTTPRRPDLLAGLRPDVMGRPRGIGQTLRPGLVFAALAIAVTSVGVAVIGSRPSDSTVGPGPSGPQASGPAATPPAATFPAPFATAIPLTVEAGSPFVLTIRDDTGVVVSAASGQPRGNGASVSDVAVAADPADPRSLFVTWTGMPCETGATLIVDGRQRTFTIERPRCLGDTVAFDRVVHLQFSTTYRADEWTGAIVDVPEPSVEPTPSAVTGGDPEPLGSPAVTPVHVILDDGVGDETSVDVVDESGRLASVVAAPGATEQGALDVAATNESPSSIRLDWVGSPCDTVHRLTIDRALATLTIDRPRCFGDAMPSWHALVLTFDGPVDANDLSTTVLSGRGGVDMPTFTATGPDSGTGSYRLQVRDLGYAVDSIDAGFDPDVAPPAEGTTLRLDQRDAATIRFVWRGPACVSDYTLDIADNGGTWTLSGLACEPANGVVLRMLDVTLRSPRTVGAVAADVVMAIP
jgi:hypothetical protein